MQLLVFVRIKNSLSSPNALRGTKNANWPRRAGRNV